VVAGFLNSLVNHADVVKIANLAQLVNVIAPIFTNEKGLFLQTAAVRQPDHDFLGIEISRKFARFAASRTLSGVSKSGSPIWR